jgi:REG-2-like HAD superfamily hydrolase
VAITTVFFDVGNTLIRPALSETEVLMQSAKTLGVSLDSQLLEQNVFELLEHYDKLFLPDDSLWASQEGAVGLYLSIFEKLCESAGVAEHARQLAELSFSRLTEPEAWKLFDDVADTLEEIKARGIKMGLISNWDRSLPKVIHGMGLGRYFEVIVASAAVGLYKPQSEIFDLALEKMGTPAEQAMHIGDNLVADVGGARGVGITPILLDRKNKHEVEDGTIKVNNFAEVMTYL